jgi:thymidylate synthase ThyX
LAGDEPAKRRIGFDIWEHYIDNPIKGLYPETIPCVYNNAWLDTINQDEIAYKQLLDDGWRPQEARSVLPNALSSKLLMTGNLRNWRHFFLMRSTKQAHPQMREVVIPLLAQFKELVPVLFDDINPDSSQIENVRKGG